MRKIFISAMVATVAINLVACGTSNSSGVTTAETTATVETTTEATTTVAETTVADTKADENVSEAVEAVDGGLQIGMAYSSAHGTKCFTQTVAVVEGDTVVAAYVDDYQFMDPSSATAVPNSDADFGADYADGTKQVLASKRVNNEFYSNNMKEKANATTKIADSFNAIQDFAVGKTVAEIREAAGKDNAVDAVSGATLADTAGYLNAIADAAEAAKKNAAVSFDGDVKDLKLNVLVGAAHGTKCFTTAAALVNGEQIILSYLDEFQMMPADQTSVTGVPNSDADFGKGFVEGKVLASKRVNAEYYSGNMKEKANATVRIDDNFDAIQNAVNGHSVADAEALSGKDNAADAVSGATLADTANYIKLIVQAAKA